jgi:hypothetical protein
VSNWAKEFDKWIGKASQPKRVVVRKGGEQGLQTIRAFIPIKPHQAEGKLMNLSCLDKSEKADSLNSIVHFSFDYLL